MWNLYNYETQLSRQKKIFYSGNFQEFYVKCIYYDYGMFYLGALSDLPSLIKVVRSLAIDFSERWIQL